MSDLTCSDRLFIVILCTVFLNCLSPWFHHLCCCPRPPPQIKRAKSTGKRDKAAKGVKKGGGDEIPDPDEVNRQFNVLMEKLGMESQNPAHFKAMQLLDTEKKWQLIVQQKKVLDESKTQTDVKARPEFWVQKLRTETSVAALRNLQIYLGTQLVDWLREFFGLGGLEVLTTQLTSLAKKSSKSKDENAVQHEIVICLKKFMNNKVGLTFVMCVDA